MSDRIPAEDEANLVENEVGVEADDDEQDRTETISSEDTLSNPTTTSSRGTPPPLRIPKSKIPVPASVYISGARAGYLADLSEQVYRDQDDFEDKENYGRRRPRLEHGLGTDFVDYGPPGILHERREIGGRGGGGRRRRRPSSEFGDSSIELLGPSETLDTDESDGSGELMEEIEGRRRRKRDEQQRAGSAASFHRFPEKRGNKRQMLKSRTVADGRDNSDDGGDGEDRHVDGFEKRRERLRRNEDLPGRPSSSKSGTTRRLDQEGKWQRVDPVRPPSMTRRTPSKSPVDRSPGGGGGLGDLRHHLKKTTGGGGGRREEERRELDGEKWRVSGATTTRKTPSKSPSKSPADRSPGRGEPGGGLSDVRQYLKKTAGGGGRREEERRGTDGEKWRVSNTATRRTPSKSPSKSPVDRAPGGGLSDARHHVKKTAGGGGGSDKRTGTKREDESRRGGGGGKDGGDQWRVSGSQKPPSRTGKPRGVGDRERDKRTSTKKTTERGDILSSGDERKITKPKREILPSLPRAESKVDTKDMDPEKLAAKLQEDEIRDTSAGMRLLQFCQSGEWYGVDGHLRYFEKRLRSGLMEDPKPLADLKDEGNGWTPFMYAIKDNRIPIAERMLDLGCDINVMTKDGLYPIHIAVLHSRDETVRFLIFKEVDLTVVTEKDRQNVLHIACTRKTGNISALLRTLFSHLPPEARLAKDMDGNIPLFIALNNEMKGACQELLGKYGEKQMAMTMGPEGDTPLHIATRKKDLEICRIFTDSGADTDAKNASGKTPLHIAAEMGDENLLKFFYLCKANPHIMDNEDRTPIFLAAMNGHSQTVDILADKFKVSVFERAKDGSTLMHIASLHGHPETAMALVRKGVPLQMPNKGGARSIHIAARNGHAGMIRSLLEKGEKVDATTNDNFTALHIGVEAVKPLVVETLLGYGALVHLKGGKDQETPLHIAARVTGGEKCALMLLKSGAEPNITMENGDTPLHVAARHGRLKIIQILLKDAGANPQKKAKDGDTPLHYACRYGHLRVVEVLLEHVKSKKSANECTLFINTVTTKGESALHYASRLNASRIRMTEEDLNGMKKEEVGRNIVKLLLDGGASVSRQTKDANETAFHYCCREGNNEILLEMLSRLSTVECQRALNRQSSKGWSPLLIASRRGHTEVVHTLLEYHARVDVFDNEGRSGLHLAAENGYQEICGILLEHRAFINAKSRVGLTALHLAAMKGFTRLCIFLIQQHGAAVDALTLKKQTPLHLGAEGGQLEVCRLLMGLRASPDATDDRGQKPIHLAAQNNHAEVIKLFLKHSSQLVNSFTKDGSTCAHLAAMQGSVAVLEELMKFDKQGVINARNRSTDATALQLAAEGGHSDLVKTLLDAGASASDENRLGYTAAHLAAKNGHMNVLEALRNAQEDSINLTSRKLGMSALHIAAFYGQTETVRDLLQYIPATSATDPPLSLATSFIKDLGTESGLTPLHMAGYSGEENVVRLLLNFEGVQVDAPTANFGFNPLHLACRGGHTTVVGLLLSRSAELLESKDGSGKASLHIAAVNGHRQMVEVLLGQGAEIDAIDKELWTPLICAAQAGHLDVVKLLVESGASPLAKTQKGQSAIWFAAAENHVDVLSYLMKRDHDTYGLLEDKDFVYNLTVAGKNIDNEPIDEFVLSSPAPVDVAAKMSSFLIYVSTKEKERAKDLIAASEHCSAMATELLALAAGAESASKVLGSVDRKGTEFLDVLIECEQKEVIAHTVVQRHLQEIWVGELVEWADWKLMLVFLFCVFCPPVWITISMPFGPKYNKIPIIKFMSYLTSHIHLMILFSLTAATPIVPVLPIRTNLNPFWFEWTLLGWLGGLLVAEVTNPSDKSGLGFVKVAVLLFSYMAIALHGVALFIEAESLGTYLYLRDQLFGLAILSACVQILDFLSFHYLFGPWAIIIGNLMKDLARFLAVLCIFMIGFSLMMVSLNHPLHERRELLPGEKQPTTLTGGSASGVLVTPVDAFEMLFFALFGLNGVDDLKIEILGQPNWTIVLFKMFFGIYLLVTVIVLINLLIAMMSDTYQRIEQQSDIEWKYGLAKLIRNMHRTTATPSPLNLFVDWGTWIYRKVKKARKPKNKLKWDADQEVDAEAEQAAAAEKIDETKIDPKQRWQMAFKKTQPEKVAEVMRMSLAQINPGLGEALGVGGSTLSSGATNRIETVTDWGLIAKKYYTLVGKEEPVEESADGDKNGSRQGSSSHMGSSMMLVSKQALNQ